MLQLRVNLPDAFEAASGVLTKDGADWLTMYMELLAKNGFSDFKVVRVET